MSSNGNHFVATEQASVAPRLKRTVAEALGMPPDALPDSASTENTAAWSSLQHLAVIAAVEEEFNITFTMDEMASAVSLPALHQTIASYQTAGGQS